MIPTRSPPAPLQGGKPRASGDDPPGPIPYETEYAVNPARAGMIPLRLYLFRHIFRKPRASGDDPSAASAIILSSR